MGTEGSSRRAYSLVVVATFTYTFLMFIWFSLPAYLTVISDELGLNGTEAGIVVGAVPLTYIALSLPSGAFVDRVGPGRSLAAGAVIYGAAQAGRSTATGFWTLLLFTLLIGIGATAITFGLPKLVSTLFPPHRTGFPSSIYLVGASSGSAIVFGLGRPTLGPLLGGWRPLFFWSGIVAVGYGLCWYAVAAMATVDASVEQDESSFSSLRADLWRVLTHRELQLLVVVGTMYLFVNHSSQGWLQTILETRGLSADRAARTVTLFIVAFASGIFTIPALADRFQIRRPALIASGVGISFGAAGLALGGTGPLSYAGIVLTALGIGGLSPLIRAIPAELDGLGSEYTGTAIGFVFAVGEIGGFIGPVAIGWLRDVTGSFVPGLLVLVTAGVVTALAGESLRQAA